MKSCGKNQTLDSNPLLLPGKRIGTRRVDERCSHSSNKRQCQMPDDEDHISQLPDEILVWILCWLTVDEAARTSVLSRRWKKQWMRMILVTPRLEFYCMKKLDCPIRFTGASVAPTTDSEMYEYLNLVNKATNLHMVPTLENFTVGFPLNSKHSEDIDKLVEFAAQKQVKKLKLDFAMKLYSSDPSNYDGFLKQETSRRSFYWLRDLYLRGVDMVDQAMHCLFSGSPFLQRLCVINSEQLHKLEVAAPNLNYLEIGKCYNLHHLNICAPNLNELKLLFCKSLVGIGNVYVPNLCHLTLGLFFFNAALILRGGAILNCFQELLGTFSQVKKTLKLRLTCKAFCEIAKVIDIGHQFPDLSNVEHLEFSIIGPFPRWCMAGLLWSHGLLWPCALVNAAPLLHKLVIKLIHRDHEFTIRDYDFKWMDEDIPAKANVRHSHGHLKVVELDGFTGCRNNVELVLHLFMIAVSLEKIIIRVWFPSSWKEEHNFRYEEYPFAKQFQLCTQLLKKIRPDVEVVMIYECSFQQKDFE